MDLLLILQAAQLVATLPGAISSLHELFQRGDDGASIGAGMDGVRQCGTGLHNALIFLAFVKDSHNRFATLTTELDKFLQSCSPKRLNADAWEALKLSWFGPLQPVQAEAKQLESQVWSVLDSMTIRRMSAKGGVAVARIVGSVEALRDIRKSWPRASEECRRAFEQAFEARHLDRAHTAVRELLSQSKRALDESNAILINYIALLTNTTAASA